MATVALETPDRCRWLLGVPRPGCAHQPIACPKTHPLPTPLSPAHPQIHLLPAHPPPAHIHPLPTAPTRAHQPILRPPHHPVPPARHCTHRSSPVHLPISHPPSHPAPSPARHPGPHPPGGCGCPSGVCAPLPGGQQPPTPLRATFTPGSGWCWC